VVAGSVIRVELLPGPRVFDIVVAAVLLPLGLWLVLTRPPAAGPGQRRLVIPAPALIVLAVAVGCVGGIYGIGDGSILAPVLTGAGRPPAEVAPAALASTFVTSVAGVITFTVLSLHEHGLVAPDWPTGSRWARVAWPVPKPGGGCSRGCPTCSSAAWSASW
jgi:uncharacterized protein